jgi:DNA-binding beta-propeller fold protein YncE
MAAWLGIQKWQQKDSGTDIAEPLKDDESAFPVIGFIGYWAITSILLFSLAGERMPWITVHMALPMILLSGWAIGQFIKTIDWKDLYSRKGWLIAILLVLFLFSGIKMLGGLLGNNPPFQGSELNQLQATSNFLASTLITVISFIGLLIYGRGLNISQLRRMGWIIVLATLSVLTARTAFRAAYINDDLATEYMVYAHSAPGVKIVMREVEDLSQRTKDGLSIDVGFDDDVSWPFTWYLRNYSQQHYFGANPTRELLDYPLIIVGDNNWGKIEPLLKSRYYSHEYNRMWWPMQDYWNLTFDRIWKAIRNPEMRSALWQIWFNRNYEPYGILEGKDFSLENWQPSDRMRLYIRKDVASLIWDYGVMPEVLSPPSLEDPYKEKMQELSAEYIIGSQGSAEGQFIRPHGIAVAADGSLFIADSSNHRIQQLSPSGEILAIWGEFGDVSTGNAPAGTFNEPWGIAVAPDGSVYVADTWNHRIQHLNANGEFINMFGESGQGETLYALWGPREVAVDQKGRVFVSDTGNKRVVVFDPNGRAIAEIGGSGYRLGDLDEPVGLAIGPDGQLYVADTWNQRIQIFEETAEGEFEAIAEWPIDGWYGQSLDNKPYLTANKAGSVCATDPEGNRILCFDNQGEFLIGWGGSGISETTFTLPGSLAFGDDGQLWVVDSGNNRVMQFRPDIP